MKKKEGKKEGRRQEEGRMIDSPGHFLSEVRAVASHEREAESPASRSCLETVGVSERTFFFSRSCSVSNISKEGRKVSVTCYVLRGANISDNHCYDTGERHHAHSFTHNILRFVLPVYCPLAPCRRRASHSQPLTATHLFRATCVYSLTLPASPRRGAVPIPAVAHYADMPCEGVGAQAGT